MFSLLSAVRPARQTRRVLALGSVLAVASATWFASPANAQTVSLDTSITVTGAGSSFLSNFVEQCKADLKKAYDINITYQPSGSGAGRSGFIGGTTDFAGSDVPFTSNEAGSLKKPFVYVPLTIGGIAIVYKVPGVDNLRLSGPTLAKIFSGGVAKWNDPIIEKDNPGVTLPAETIRVIVRSDSSGTSNVFTDYLDTAGGGFWKKGNTSTFPVPAGTGIAQRGSDGVTNYVAGEQGNFSITYAEASFAVERKLPVASVINNAGEAVKPDAKAVTAAIADAKVNDDGTLFLAFNTPKPDAYPISTTSYLIVPTTIDAKKGDVLRTFIANALGACQSKAAGLGYAPLPKNVADLGNAALAKINPGAGAVPLLNSAAPAATGAAATTTVVPATVAGKAPATTAKAAPTTKAKAKAKPTKPVATKKK
jgi:phosphate transport system substrate-binding protein